MTFYFIAIAALLSAAGTFFAIRSYCRKKTQSASPREVLSPAENDKPQSELEQRLLHRTRELAALNAVALALGQAATLKDVLDKSLAKIFDTLDGLERRGAVFLCEPDGESLRLTAEHGLSPEVLHSSKVLHINECLCKKVIETGDISYAEDASKHLAEAEDAALATPAHVIIPIKSRGLVLGVFFLFPTPNFKLSVFDLQLLEIIGAQLGLAVENFRFYAEVKQASEKYWGLFENAGDILFIIDAAGDLVAVNKAAEEFSGYSKTELIGKNVRDFLTSESTQTAVRVLAGSLPRVIEVEVLKRDGTHAFLEVSTRKLSTSLIGSGYQISARDVTEQKNLRDMLLKSERLGAIGQVGVAMRHEINNPLTTVIGNIELLLERFETRDSDTVARLQVILNNALRIAEIIKRVEQLKQDKVVEYLKGIKMTDLKKD